MELRNYGYSMYVLSRKDIFIDDPLINFVKGNIIDEKLIKKLCQIVLPFFIVPLNLKTN